MNRLVVFLLALIFVSGVLAQKPFFENQKSYPRVQSALSSKNEILKKAYEEKHLQWPPKQIYLRSFKYDSKLEVWARNTMTDTFSLFKTYKVCALSGSIGPKRIVGDYQVPEGFYYVNEFNPKSNYHLSLGLNYPNTSDQMLSDPSMPGNNIFIHGSCVTQGCIPLQDEQIEELYLLAAYAKSAGQDFIPVHIFPINYNVEKSKDYLIKNSITNLSYQKFSNKLKMVFDFFEQFKKLPIITINKEGSYELY